MPHITHAVEQMIMEMREAHGGLSADSHSVPSCVHRMAAS